jgi:glycosyltransferase involved in cell wall biosynthesis
VENSTPFEHLLLANSGPGTMYPFITVAIPHYRRRRYLEVVLNSLFEQAYDDFEIIVSDDCSPDDSNQIIPTLLQQSGRPFRYYTQSANLGYDGNVRFCLAAARGKYVLLLGNDDALAGPTTLREIATQLRQLDLPEVAFTSFSDWSNGAVTRRAQQTRLLGSGPEIAIRVFRSFSFVSGLIFSRVAAQQHDTDRWDQSVFYQIYLASRIIAAGGRLATLDTYAIRKDVTIAGEVASSYAIRWSNAGWSFQPRHTGLDSVIRVTANAVLPFFPVEQRSAALRRIISQVLFINYSFWLLEYRRVANWSFAIGIARDMWVRKLLAEYRLTYQDRLRLWLIYLATTIAGLAIPTLLFNSLSSSLANAVRNVQQHTGNPVVTQ